MPATEMVKARIRKRPSGTIGSGTRDSIQDEDGAERQADQDQPADRGVGPVAGLLVGEADEERRDGEGEDGRAHVVDVASRLPGRRTAGSRRHITTSETSPIGTLTKKIQCQVNWSVMKPPMPGPTSDDSPKTAPKRPRYLPRSAGRVQVRDDRQRDREDRAAAQPLHAAEQDQLPHLLAESGQDRTDQEQADRPDEDRPAAEQVGQLAVDRPADRCGQQVDRHDPGVERVAAAGRSRSGAGPCRRRSGPGQTGTARAGSRRGSRDGPGS